METWLAVISCAMMISFQFRFKQKTNSKFSSDDILLVYLYAKNKFDLIYWDEAHRRTLSFDSITNFPKNSWLTTAELFSKCQKLNLRIWFCGLVVWCACIYFVYISMRIVDVPSELSIHQMIQILSLIRFHQTMPCRQFNWNQSKLNPIPFYLILLDILSNTKMKSHRFWDGYRLFTIKFSIESSCYNSKNPKKRWCSN